MITENSLTTEWYDNLNTQYKSFDFNLLDKVNHAFYLLEKLSHTRLNFIFKDGTCLLLLLKEMKRFSIDIDIVITDSISEEELTTFLQEVCDQSIFTHFEEQIRYKTAIPKAHYKFYYSSPLDKTESYVLLDILFEKSPYTRLIKIPIESSFIDTKPPIKFVTVPDIENILGDNLAAFAPNTTGIPYGQGKEMEIIKQLFDIESLFDQAVNLGEIKKTFINCAEQELVYRQLEGLNPVDVLDDILRTACIIGGRGSIDKETFLQLEDGIRRIKSHIIDRNYIVEEAVVSAAKASYLVNLLKTDATEITRFDPSLPLKDMTGVPLFKKMAKMKKFSPEAYYYFVKAQEIN